MNTAALESLPSDYTALLAQFSAQQKIVLDLCEKHPEIFNIQYHPDLSPLGWHLGHCVYTENYWIRQQLLDTPLADEQLQSLYVPELANKIERAGALPDHADLCSWTREQQQGNLGLLNDYSGDYQDLNYSPLMQNHFLLHFLIQHYAQHSEVMRMIFVQALLQSELQYQVKHVLMSHEVDATSVVLPAGNYNVGSQTNFLPYDNEYPPHEFKTAGVNFAARPVSNSEFLLFMEDSAYQTQKYWSGAGWQWQQQRQVSCPEFWRQDAQQNWFGVDSDGAHDLEPEQAVWGLNYFEAQAFANWFSARTPGTTARLPHEYEWQAAQQQHCLMRTGEVWEWCENNFHPYSGFEAFPYDGYSLPYFDNAHFVMKGASRYTHAVIQRASFRNYYQADKRHQFAGCRLVFE